MPAEANSPAPRVSVLLPARDAGATLAACLRSLERQTERHWECVLVDDGSRDETAAIARRFAAGDGRLRVMAGPAAGLVAALESGLRHCRGRFVARMDADDLAHRDRLRAQLDALEAERDVVAVGSHVRMFPRRGLGPGDRAYERWINGIVDEHDVRREAFVECPLAHPTLLIRREVLQEFGYRDRGWPEDYDLVLRLLGRGLRLRVVPRRLLAWRHQGRRLSRESAAYRPERFTACKAAFLASSFLADVERYVLWGYGATGRALAAALACLGKRPSHIVEVHPGRLGNRIRGAAVVPPDALAALPRRPLIVSVAGARPRAEIRAWLADLGYRELTDFLCAA